MSSVLPEESQSFPWWVSSDFHLLDTKYSCIWAWSIFSLSECAKKICIADGLVRGRRISLSCHRSVMRSHHVKSTFFCTSNVRLRYSWASELSSSEVHPMAERATSITSRFGNSLGEKVVVPVTAQLCSQLMSQAVEGFHNLNKEAQKTEPHVKSRGNFFTLLRWRWYMQ